MRRTDRKWPDSAAIECSAAYATRRVRLTSGQATPLSELGNWIFVLDLTRAGCLALFALCLLICLVLVLAFFFLFTILSWFTLACLC